MSDYNLQIAWSGKDALGDTDPDKVISGGDFNTEFLAVKTAVNSKANLGGSASQAFLATTANAGTNTTQVATTAFVTASTGAVTAAFINNLVYPVGSIYTNMEVATNPATLLGVGTWVAYAEGRVLVGKAASGTFDTLNEELGSETHALSVAEMPAHTHSFTYVNRGDAWGEGYAMSAVTGGSTRTTSSQGSGSAHTNLQPSVTVYMWKRTA
jgi:hypothetical protein